MDYWYAFANYMKLQSNMLYVDNSIEWYEIGHPFNTTAKGG